MSKRNKFRSEDKLRIAIECSEGKKGVSEAGREIGAGEMAIKYNVSYQQVYNWTNKFAELGEAALEDRRGQRTAQQTPRTPEEELKIRIAQLEHENYMLKMERDLLKKLEEIERRRG